MNEKQEILKSILTMVDKSVTKEEFLKAYQTLMEFVVKIEKRNGTEMEGMWKEISSKLLTAESKLETGNEKNFESLKKELTSEVSKQVNNMYGDWTKLSSLINKRIDELKDGEDADEERVAEIVLSKIPKQEIELDTPESIRGKLEGLIGDERLDKSAIKGIDEAIAEIAKTGKATFVSGTAKPIRLTNNGTLIEKNIRNLNFKGTAITSIVRNADGVIDITIDNSFEELTATGAVDGANLSFIFTKKPTYIMSDGIRLRENHGWTWTALTLTALLEVPPQYDLWSESY